MTILNAPVTSTKGHKYQYFGSSGATSEALWDVCHDGAGDGSGIDMLSGWQENTNWELYLFRTYLQFDTSDVGTGTISSVKLKISGIQHTRNTSDDYKVGSASSSDYGDLKTTTDYGTFTKRGTGTGYRAFTDVEVTLNAAGIAGINKTGNTLLSMRGVGDTTDVFPNNADSYDRLTISSATLIVEYVDLVAPTVTTQAASLVEATTATLNGNVTATGGADVTTRGFYWLQGTTGTPTSANNTASTSGTFGTGAFTENLTGLTANTTYRAVAFATNSAGTTVDTTVIQFTTDTTPTVSTLAASSVNKTTATLNGNITNTGGDDADTWGFYLKAGAGTPTAGDTVISSTGTQGTGVFAESATGLTEDTLYSVVAFATNSVGTSTGSVVEFTTSATVIVRNPNMAFFTMFT